MRRYGDLWDSFVAWDNLILAAHKARRGKRHRPVVQRFEFHREAELLRLQRELQAGAWLPGSFTTHWIERPKPRLISAASYRDRVVHHALINVLEPILDRHFHPASFACRKGKGTHAAGRRLQQLLRRNRWTLQCDVRKFFPSIDHAVLKELFRRRIKDRRLLEVMDRIVDGSNEQERMFVGYRTWAGHRLLPAASVRAFVRRLRWMKRAYAERRGHSDSVVELVGAGRPGGRTAAGATVGAILGISPVSRDAPAERLGRNAPLARRG